jgi:hypothetical protein
MSLPGVARRSPWHCSVRFRGGRPAAIEQPLAQIAIDGVPSAASRATNAYQDLDVVVAAGTRRGLTIAIASVPTFVPGPQDRRELGVQVDRLACRPGSALILPPGRTLASAAWVGAAFGGAYALAGIGGATAAVALAAIAIAQALPLSAGPALYTPFGERAGSLAFVIALVMLLGVQILERWRRERLTAAAAAVMVVSSGALYLQLLALLHPSKALVDAVFHAHRLEWVMAGRYFFTQSMPDGVQFPYAIALYVFAAPWAALTSDHVSLLRAVVCASQALAGALLYPAIVRAWGDRLAGALAVGLFSLVPLSYVIVGNANLTSAFGQSAALVAMAAATTWSLARYRLIQVVALTGLAALAFLSHVHTFPLLLATLLVLAIAYRLWGGATLRTPAVSVAAATIAAAVLSVVVYYGHFGEVYERLERVTRRATAVVAPAAVPRDVSEPGAAAQPPVERQGRTPPSVRVGRALASSVRAVGWPIVVLAAFGAWRVGRDGVRDRLGLALVAWGVAYLAFGAFGSLMPVDERFVRYAAEFVDRVNYATVPAAVILAARGAAWGWRAGILPCAASATLLLAAIGVGARQWLAWFS